MRVAPPDEKREHGPRARAAAVSKRGQEWVERQTPDSASGVAIGAWRRYRAVDGPLQSALLSLYILVAIIPAVLVMQEYLERNPVAFANHLVHHLNLSAQTGALLRGVLVQDRTHELGSALLAVAGALFFGLGFGRVLQLVHGRAWQLPLQMRMTDQGLYAAVLLALYGLILLLVVQLKELRGSPVWAEKVLALGWVALLVGFFVWAPWLLLHKEVSKRDLLPGAIVTAVGVVALMFLARYVMEYWVNFYAKDYGGLGVVLAMYFWLAFSSAVIVWAAAISPALAVRRSLRNSS